MAIQDTIKSYFETGDIPTQAQFYQWIDELMFTDDLSTHFATGLMTVGLDGGFTPSAGTVMAGDTIFEALQKLQGSVGSGDFVARTGDTMSGSLLFSGGVGIDTTLTGGSDVLSIGVTNADVINIGRSGITVNIQGNTFYQNVTELQVADKLFTLNKGGSAASASGSGFELEENSLITGYFKTNGARTGWELKAPGSAGIATIINPSSNWTYTLPESSGTLFQLPSLTSGSILYSNGTTIDQDNANLFYDSSGKILYVGSNSNPLTLLNLKAYFQGNIDSYSQINSININAGASASGDIVISANNATDSARYINLGINSSGNASAGILGGALNGYLYIADGDLAVGTSTAKDLKLFTGGTAATNERLRITSFGYSGFHQSQKLAQVGITQFADFVATGTTTANATGSITGSGTRYLSEIAVGDYISLSSAPSTFFIVTSIVSDTSLGVTNSMGNGTTQTINVRKSPFSTLSSTGTHLFTIGGSGTIGIGQIPTTTSILGVTSTGSVNAIVGTASSGSGITGTGGTGGTFNGTTTGVSATSTSTLTTAFAVFARKSSNTNSNDAVLTVNKQVVSGTGSAGISAMTYYQMSDDAPSVIPFGKFGMIATNVTSSGSLQQADWAWFTLASGTGTMTERMRLSGAGNLGIGTSTFGASMTRGIAILNGTAPSGGITDVSQMYVNDIAAGNAAFHFRTELGQIVKLYNVNAGNAYSITNGSTDRAMDTTTALPAEIANVLYTLIEDLKLTGIII